jgi:hypothetical protein
MNFCKQLYLETKECHNQVDIHPFVELIKINTKAGDIYIEFNKICINAIQTKNFLPILLEKKLNRNCKSKRKTSLSNYELQLINRCKKFPLEHEYLFKLGLLAGGNMLKKYISKEHHQFLTFENPKELIIEFKTYINDNVFINNQDKFIENVKESYKLIKNIFDEYFLDF